MAISSFLGIYLFPVQTRNYLEVNTIFGTFFWEASDRKAFACKDGPLPCFFDCKWFATVKNLKKKIFFKLINPEINFHFV